METSLGKTSRDVNPDMLRNFPESLSAILQLSDSKVWKEFIENIHCEAAFPDTVKASPFQQILAIAFLRPDRLVSGMSQFAAKSLKLPDLSTDTSLRTIFSESSSSNAILLITSSGSDPTAELADLAKEVRMDGDFQQVNLVYVHRRTQIKSPSSKI